MYPILEQTIYIDFITSAATGAAADADSLPTAEVFDNATDTTLITPFVAKRTSKTGDYRVTVPCLSASGFTAGHSYNIIASATVGGVAAKARVASFQVISVFPTNLLQINGIAVRTDDGLAQGGSTSGIQLTSTSSSTDNYYKDWIVRGASGTGSTNKPTAITSYTGSTKQALFLPNVVGTAYDGTSYYILDPPVSANITEINSTSTSGSIPVSVNVAVNGFSVR